MNISLKNDAAKTVQFAKQVLLRYLYDHGFSDGDRLPGREQLSRELNLASSTLLRAINGLKNDGIFVTNRRVGTFIRPGALAGMLGRSIGVLLPEHPSIFVCMLGLYLQHTLIQRGCLPVPFIRREVDQWQPSGLDNIPGLEMALRNDKLDGVIDLCDVAIAPEDHRFDHIPFIFVGNTERAQRGISIDLVGFLRTALRQARRYRFRCPAMVVTAGTYSERVLNPVFRQEFNALRFDGCAEVNILKAAWPHQGRALAAEVLALPPEARPDVLILMDEYVGNDLLTALRLQDSAEAARYHPAAMVYMNTEQPLTLAARRVIVYRKSLIELAGRAVDYLLDCLRGVGRENALEYLPFDETEEWSFFADHTD